MPIKFPKTYNLALITSCLGDMKFKKKKQKTKILELLEFVTVSKNTRINQLVSVLEEALTQRIKRFFFRTLSSASVSQNIK